MKTFKCSKSLSNIKKNIFTILGRPLTFFTPQKKKLNCPVLSIAHLLLRSLLQFMRDARCLGILHLAPRLSENCGSVVSWARYPTELPYYAIVEACWMGKMTGNYGIWGGNGGLIFWDTLTFMGFKGNLRLAITSWRDAVIGVFLTGRSTAVMWTWDLRFNTSYQQLFCFGEL